MTLFIGLRGMRQRGARRCGSTSTKYEVALLTPRTGDDVVPLLPYLILVTLRLHIDFIATSAELDSVETDTSRSLGKAMTSETRNPELEPGGCRL